jgi:ActR/RegA family two-component response regulator
MECQADDGAVAEDDEHVKVEPERRQKISEEARQLGLHRLPRQRPVSDLRSML